MNDITFLIFHEQNTYISCTKDAVAAVADKITAMPDRIEIESDNEKIEIKEDE